MHKPVALITGASTGIGYEMAKVLAAKGYDLVVVARNAKKLKELGQIDLNVRALTELCHLYGAEMAKRKAGRILNVASTAAFQPGPWMSVYYATKAYVLHFSEGIAEELKKSGVQVSVLCPGPTITEFARTAGMDKSLLFSSKLMKPATAQYVAKYGVEKLLKGKLIIIPGFMNRAMAFSNRFSPRFLVRKIAGYLNGGG